MKTLTLKCKNCSRTRQFFGENVEEILKLIDFSGWRDMPDDDGGITALCPEHDTNEDEA